MSVILMLEILEQNLVGVKPKFGTDIRNYGYGDSHIFRKHIII